MRSSPMRMKSSGAFRWLRLAVAVAVVVSEDSPLRVALAATERETVGAASLREEEAAELRLTVLWAAELREVLWAAELREVL